MKVLMLGWEFPPYFAGGVGVVCQHLAGSLGARGHDITFVMPSGAEGLQAGPVRLLSASHFAPGLNALRVESALVPYATPEGEPHAADRPLERVRAEVGALYGSHLLQEVELFAGSVVQLASALGLEFDVIHAHDWTTFPAGAALRRATGKPLLTHVHITEFDKTGGEHADPAVYAIEKAGMDAADRVVAVSQLVARRCVEQYFCAPAKVRVVHNAVDAGEFHGARSTRLGQIVLFLGRMTMQKGPDYFIEAARRVLEHRPDTTFVLSGSGDLLDRMIERSAELGIGPRMLFTGFVSRDEVAALYALADVFVMPSVSEPFGIVPLEAMAAGVPTIVSRQSGVSEIVRHALKVDFWNVEDLAAKIVSALSYPTLASELGERGAREAEGLTWDAVAAATEVLYEEVLHA